MLSKYITINADASKKLCDQLRADALSKVEKATSLLQFKQMRTGVLFEYDEKAVGQSKLPARASLLDALNSMLEKRELLSKLSDVEKKAEEQEQALEASMQKQRELAEAMERQRLQHVATLKELEAKIEQDKQAQQEALEAQKRDFDEKHQVKFLCVFLYRLN